MKRTISCILISFITLALLGQQEVLMKQSYAELSFSRFVEEVEKMSDLHFYYENEWVDSIVLHDLRSGESVNEILHKALNEHGLQHYSSASQVFIYPGEGIVTVLPVYENPLATPEPPGASVGIQPASDKEYIPTKDVLKEELIVIGNNSNSSGNKKCLIRGSIINNRDNEALIGATIYFMDLDQGVISDATGHFEMMLFPGEYRVSANHMAMKETRYLFRVLSPGAFSLELEDEIVELQEVTISNDRFDNVKSLQMGYDRVTVKAMKEIPFVMGEKDILQVAQMLPGVQNVGEGSSGFNVRGGSTDQNMFYINGISVYNTSHLFGFFTAFSPDVVNDFTLYKNNIPTKYGGRVASVFDITTRKGNNKEFFAHGGISPITGHFSMEGPIVKEKVTIVASFRSTYSDWLLKRVKDQNLRESNASFADGTLGINADISENDQLSFFFYRSADQFSLSSIHDYKYSNTGASLNWTHKFSSSLSAETSFASSAYQFLHYNKQNVSEAYSQEYSIQHSELRSDFLLLKYDNHRIEFGVNSILYNLDRGDILPFGEESTRSIIHLGKEQGLENAIYISDEVGLFPRLDMMAGLRYSFYGQLGPAEVFNYLEGVPKEINNISGQTSYKPGESVRWYSGLEPRLAFNFRISNVSSVKASYNRLHQYIYQLSNTIAIAPTDQWKLVDYHIRPPVADQLSLGYYRDSQNKGYSLSVEIYKKWVQNVVDYKNGADFISGLPIEQMVLQGKQDSKGVEFLLKKNSKRITGWLSYAYSRSFLQMNGLDASERINNGAPYPTNFDRPHSLNLVSNLRLKRRISFSSNIVYATGRPVTLPVAIYYAENQPLLLYSDRNQYRIPDYFRVDFSLNVEGNLKFQKFGHSYWMFNVYNLTGRENAYSVFYTAEDRQIQGYKLSIFARPIVTVSWHLKLGNYSSDNN